MSWPSAASDLAEVRMLILMRGMLGKVSNQQLLFQGSAMVVVRKNIARGRWIGHFPHTVDFFVLAP